MNNAFLSRLSAALTAEGGWHVASVWRSSPRGACPSIRASLWLDFFGMPRRLRGYRMLCEAVALCAARPTAAANPHCSVYPALAKRLNATVAGVERNIRTSIETLWLHGNFDRLALLPAEIAPDRGKPTNRQMIAALAELVINPPPLA